MPEKFFHKNSFGAFSGMRRLTFLKHIVLLLNMKDIFHLFFLTTGHFVMFCPITDKKGKNRKEADNHEKDGY
jgi:hypothetical protein